MFTVNDLNRTIIYTQVIRPIFTDCTFLHTFVVLQSKKTKTAFRGFSISGGFATALFDSRLRVVGPLRTLTFVGARLAS